MKELRAALDGQLAASVASSRLPQGDPLGLAVSQVRPDGRLILFVDQFEELFTTCADPAERTEFVESLTRVARHQVEQIGIVVAIRADFYGQCAEYPELAELLGANQVLVTLMSPDELRRAIELPSRRVGVRVESALTDVLVAEVSDEPGGLPLLSTALVELWEQRNDGWLRMESYGETGGLRGAVSRLAEAAYAQLTTDQQGIGRSIFLRLAGTGEGEAVVRRRTPISEFDLDRDPELGTVLSILTDRRLLTMSDGMVEVAHEALFREWPRLREWLEEDVQGRQLRRHLTETAKQWNENERDSAELYRGARLSSVLDWSQEHQAELNEREREFLTASRRAGEAEAERQRRTNRRLRVLLSGVAIFLVMALVAGGLAFVQQRRAVDQKHQAEAQRRVALSRELAATALSKLSVDPELSILLASEAARVTPTAEAEHALRQSLSESRVRRVLRGHTAPLSTARFSLDGRLVVTASRDGTARLWDATSGQTVRILRGHSGAIEDAEFSSDGARVVTAGGDGTARVWDVANAKVVSLLRGHAGAVLWAEFSPDETSVVTASGDNTARVWEASSGRTVAILRGHTAPVYRARFSPDGKWVVTASQDRTVRIWLARTGAQSRVLRHNQPVSDAAFSHDGRLVATASQDQPKVWDTATGRVVGNLPRQIAGVSSVAFSPADDLIVIGGEDGVASVWLSRGTRLVIALRGHTGPVMEALFSPDGRSVLTAGRDGTARLWELSTGQSTLVFRGHSGALASASFSADGRYVVTTSADHTARVWDAAVGNIVAVLKGPPGPVASARFSPEGHLVMTASESGVTSVWNANSGRLLHELRSQAAVTSAEFSPTGQLIATASDDGTSRIWQTSTGKVMAVLAGHSGKVTSAAFSPDGRMVVAAGVDGTVRVWASPSGRSIALLRWEAVPQGRATFSPDGRLIAAPDAAGRAVVWSVARKKVAATLTTRDQLSRHPLTAVFSPDGRRILSAGFGDFTALLWDPQTGRPTTQFSGHSGIIEAATFSSDGKLVATAGRDGTARVWEARTGRLVAVLSGHSGTVTDAQFSPRGGFVVTSSQDGTTRVWESRTGNLVMVLQGHGGPVPHAEFNPTGDRIVAAGENDAIVYSCDVCLSLHGLLDLARTRVTRGLTPAERAKYLRRSTGV